MHDLLTFLFHVILVSFLLQLIKYPDKSTQWGNIYLVHNLRLQSIAAEDGGHSDRLVIHEE